MQEQSRRQPRVRRACIGVAILFILASCSSGDPEVSSSTRSIATNLLDCTHKAVGRVFSTLAGSCTGSYIGRGWVLTAGHCVSQNNLLCCATVGVPAGCTHECPVVHGHQLSFELNGVTYHGLFSYDTGNWVRLHPEYYHSGHTPNNDIAVFRLQGMENPANWPENRSGADQVWPMQVSAQKPATGDKLLYIGYGPSSWDDSDYQRRRTQKTVGKIWADTYELGSGDPPVGGDSGGPSLKNEQIVGVHSTTNTDAPVGPSHAWINGPGGCDGCLSGLTFPPPASYDPEDRKTPFCTVDDDGDGVPQWRDNCPDDRNPDQMNCNAKDDPALHGKLLGDACDPTPCLYIPAVRRVSTSSAAGFHMSAGKARVYYRGVKKTAAASEARDIDAYYCACHDPTAAPYDPQNPKVFSRSNCVLYGCRDDGFTHRNIKKDTGYDRILWSLGPGQSCPREDLDGNGVFNECKKPVPAQPFYSLYKGTALGDTPGDFERFFTEGPAFRTRSVEWDWRMQDYPHPEGHAFKPPVSKGYVRVWLRPVQSGLSPLRNNTYTQPMSFNARLEPGFFQALTPWDAEYWDPHPHAGVLDPLEPLAAGPLVLRPLRRGRPLGGIERLAWSSVSRSSALSGLLAVPLDPVTGATGQPLPGRAEPGHAVDTLGFASASLGGAIYVFGGQDGNGQLSGTLWRGRRVESWNGQTGPFFAWQKIPVSGPSPRRGAILVADPERGRLILMYGTTPAGDTSDVWAFHLASGTWRRIEARIRDDVPRHDAGYWSAAGKLFVYGGRAGERILGGLWRVDLSSLRGEMVGERGPRAGAGLFCDAAARTIYLFGGEGPAGLMNDLQRYDLRRRAWEGLGDRRGEVPPAMAGAGLLVSPVDGAITVLAGSSGERRDALWQLGPSGWRSHRRILGAER